MYIITLLACERKNGRNYSGQLNWNEETMKSIYELYNSKFKTGNGHSLEFLRVLLERLQTHRKEVEDYVQKKKNTFNSLSWQTDELDTRFNLIKRELSAATSYVKKADTEFNKLALACETLLKQIDELLLVVTQAHEEKKKTAEETKAVEQNGTGAKLLNVTVPEKNKTESEVD